MKAEIPAALEGERVDRAIALLCDVTRARAAALVAEGAVRLDGAAVAIRSRRVAAGQALDVDLAGVGGAAPALAPDPSVGVVVVHEDAAVIVVDKPPGLVVHPGAGHATGTLAQGLLSRYPELAGVGEAGRPGIVHRLDVGTSGLLVVARTPQAYASLVRQLAAHTVDRRYVALVWGTVGAGAGLVDAPIGRSANDPTQMAVAETGRPARTRYEVLARFAAPAPTTLLECRLETGRTHQVRVHLAAIGHPVVGDARYRGRRRSVPAPRPFLHAHRLAFDHPARGERSHHHSPLPADLEDVRELLA